MPFQKSRMKNIGSKFILLLILTFHPLCAFSIESVEISGKILVPEKVKIPEGGLDVVLLKFVVNEQGEITTTGPQARVKSQPDGSFRILDVPRDLRAAYRIGTRVEGRLHQSNVVFLNDQDSSYQVEVQVPGISQKVELLELEKASLILERDLGKVRVTEVWEINNPSRDLIDSVNSGYRINLPKDISDFSMADETGQSSSDFRLGEHFLEIMRIFPPGNSQLIFQYSISSFLGQTVLTKSFGNSLEKVRIFTPVELLDVSSTQLKYIGDQKLHQTVFISWQGKELDTGTLELSISGVPVNFLDYSYIMVVLLILLGFSVFMFYRLRLKKMK